MIRKLSLNTEKQGLHDITGQARLVVEEANIREGLCTLFVQHTSASLLIQENCDSTARDDLENWLNRMVPEGDSLYTHTLEGDDDMPAHIKSALTSVSLSIPILDGQLCLGTWQGIYLWEHRHQPSTRKVIVHIQ